MSRTQKNIACDVYNAEKKSYAVICQGKKLELQRFEEKILTQSKSPIPPSPTKVTWSTT